MQEHLRGFQQISKGYLEVSKNFLRLSRAFVRVSWAFQGVPCGVTGASRGFRGLSGVFGAFQEASKLPQGCFPLGIWEVPEDLREISGGFSGYQLNTKAYQKDPRRRDLWGVSRAS